MNFELSDEHRMLKDLVARFVTEELIPLEAATLAREAAGQSIDLPPTDLARVNERTRDLGLWGLDAPERKQAGGSEATRALRSLITGTTLDCQVRDIDRYHRIVAQCFLPDGRDIAAEMIRMGVATEYCRYSGGYYQTC